MSRWFQKEYSSTVKMATVTSHWRVTTSILRYLVQVASLYKMTIPSLQDCPLLERLILSNLDTPNIRLRHVIVSNDDPYTSGRPVNWTHNMKMLNRLWRQLCLFVPNPLILQCWFIPCYLISPVAFLFEITPRACRNVNRYIRNALWYCIGSTSGANAPITYWRTKSNWTRPLLWNQYTKW